MSNKAERSTSTSLMIQIEELGTDGHKNTSYNCVKPFVFFVLSVVT